MSLSIFGIIGIIMIIIGVGLFYFSKDIANFLKQKISK